MHRPTARATQAALTIILVLLVVSSRLVAQTVVYENAYRTTLDDGEISIEEQDILQSLQNTLNLTEDQVMEIQRRFEESGVQPVRARLSRAGRRRIIVQNMYFGDILYGFGIPYVLGAKSPKVFLGMQALSFASGFYYSWRFTENMDIPHGRATFQNNGSVAGLLSIYPVMATVGFENWSDIDEEGKITLTYMMLAVPGGIYLSDQLYERWQPSDGQASVVAGAAALGIFHSFVGQLLFTNLDKGPGESWFRINALLVSAGYLGSGYLGWKYFEQQSLTRGDAYFMSLGAGLGYLNSMQLIFLTEPKFKAGMIMMLLSVDAGVYTAYRLGRNHDLTTGETAIIGLGSLAGAAAIRGTALILGADQDSDALIVGDILARTFGAYLTFKNIKPRQSRANINSRRVSLSISPTLVNMDKRLVMGLSAGLQF